ncbi:complement factor H like 4 [Dicentrarchus labrax]|uniref:complement factor H like 4 n=1 Tax=Dicentrarchus labrax TaxID=13489 RepID=UPI0021F575D4|nr:complement factor H like 4 [Dicentrarchus labrax]
MWSPLILLFLQLWTTEQVPLSQNITCSAVPEVSNAYVSEETKKDEYQGGNVIRFTCETGYISGPAIRFVCTDEGWVALNKGKCYLKPCVLPEETPNGYYQIIHGEDFVFGTTVKYFCNEGYQMVSKTDTRTCKLDKWSNHLPICDPFSCDYPPADGGLIVKGLPENDEPILPDRFLTFSCQYGKFLNGSSRLICGNDGQWNEPLPTCEDVTCVVAVMSSHLNVIGEQRANERVKVGHKLQFRCNNPHLLEGSEEIECLGTGQWNTPFPTCSENCRVAHVPPSVKLNTNVPENGLREGQSLRFTCRQRQHSIQGTEVVRCLPGGQWSHPFPTCAGPVGCQRPPPLTDGDIRASLKSQYNHNERVEYMCQNYYTMDGQPHKTCVNGEWIGQMRCLRPCTVNEELIKAHNIIFRFVDIRKLYIPHNDQLEFMCVRGRRHDRVLGMRQTCHDGEMSLPTCGTEEKMNAITRSFVLFLWMHTLIFVESQEAICNKYDPLVTSWRKYWTQVKLRETIGYTCRRGYKGTDGTNVATCTRDGWSPNPLCQEIICFRQAIDNADFVDKRKREYKYNERINYACTEGFKGNPSRICTENGWIGDSECTEITCIREAIDNAEFDNKHKWEYKYNERINYACTEGYKGSPHRICKANGWTGKSKCTAITCKDCPEPLGCETAPLLADGDLKYTKKSNYSNNETVEYMCPSFYTMEGEPYRTCINGEWTGHMRCLKPCVVNEDDFRQHNITLKSSDNKYFTHDEIIEFRCARGIPVGAVAMRQRCNGGVVLLPTCQ